ncbi:MAG TPA: protealysin inhibitor emfourin [Polyangiales bacterium]|nr:protealysin inhibitor emfourin [Polyangiales bacterium]
MKLTLERFGGVAGLPAKPLVIDTAQLDANERQRIEALAARALDAPAADGGGRIQPDSFHYELTVDEQTRSFEFTHASHVLRELVAALRKLAR